MYDVHWNRLLELLAAWTTVTEVVPGRRLRVAVPGENREVDVLMTREEWDEAVTVLWGWDVDGAAERVRETIHGLGAEEGFLLYGDYELVPSATEELPEDPDLPQHLGRGGYWFAYGGKEVQGGPEPPPA